MHSRGRSGSGTLRWQLTAAAYRPPALSAGAASGEAFVLDEKCAAMTVEQYMRFFLEEMIGQAQECVDEAIDAVSLLYKQQREELQEYRHQQRVEQAAKHKAGAPGPQLLQSAAHVLPPAVADCPRRPLTACWVVQPASGCGTST